MAALDHIQALIDHEMTLTAFCAQNHYRQLDLQKLGKWLGFDHSTMHADLTHKLWCPTCQGEIKGILLAKASRAGPPSTWGMKPPG